MDLLPIETRSRKLIGGSDSGGGSGSLLMMLLLVVVMGLVVLVLVMLLLWLMMVVLKRCRIRHQRGVRQGGCNRHGSGSRWWMLLMLLHLLLVWRLLLVHHYVLERCLKTKILKVIPIHRHVRKPFGSIYGMAVAPHLIIIYHGAHLRHCSCRC